MEPETEGVPTWIAACADGTRQGSPLPRSTGESEPQLWLNDKCAEVGSEDSLWGTAIGVEWNMGGGRRGWCAGVHDLLRSRDGLALVSCHCFTLRLSDGLSCPCDLSHLVLLQHSWPPSASLHQGEHLQGQSDACFGFLTFPFMIFVMVPVTRLMSIFVSVLSGPGFLFFFCAVCGLLVPCGSAFHCAEVSVWVTIRKDGFLILINHQWFSYLLCIRIMRWWAQHGRHNFAPARRHKQWEEW